jgi:transposase-like protein
METTKVCLRCGQEKSEISFSKHPRYSDGLYPYCKACRKFRYQNSKATIQHYQKRWREQNPELTLLRHARSRAKRKGIVFDLREEDITVPLNCPVLGIPLCAGDGKFGPSSPTLDRHDPVKGYVRGNVAVISFRANLLKNDATIEELEAVIHWMKSPTFTPPREVRLRKKGGWKNPHEGRPVSAAAKVLIAASKRSLSEEQVVLCRRMYDEGQTLKKIATELGVSVKPVFNAIHRVGAYSLIP